MKNLDWKHYLSIGLVLAAVADKAAAAWLAQGHSLPFDITAAGLVMGAYVLSMISKSVLGTDVTAQALEAKAKAVEEKPADKS